MANTQNSLNGPKGFLLACPNDGAEMEKVKAGTFEIDRCTRCGAMWFDMAELQRMVAHHLPLEEFDTFADKSVKRPTMTKRCCPRDDTPLADASDPNQPQVIYHQCNTCGGLLLDAGQLRDFGSYTLVERVKSFFRF